MSAAQRRCLEELAAAGSDGLAEYQLRARGHRNRTVAAVWRQGLAEMFLVQGPGWQRAKLRITPDGVAALCVPAAARRARGSR